MDIGNWLISKNWLPPPSATVEIPPLRPFISVNVEPRPKPRKLNWAVPIKSPDSVWNSEPILTGRLIAKSVIVLAPSASISSRFLTWTGDIAVYPDLWMFDPVTTTSSTSLLVDSCPFVFIDRKNGKTNTNPSIFLFIRYLLN